MAIFAISDVHADYAENLAWIEALAPPGEEAASLIVAGDVSHDLAVVEKVFVTLKARFAKVFFVFGNHDLWLRRDDSEDSFRKLARLDDLCARLGVETGSAQVDGVWVVPLRSWYNGSLAVDGAPQHADRAAWSDDRRCRWPVSEMAVAQFFLQSNAPQLRTYDGPVLSFSHFLPRADLLPKREVLHFKSLPEVAGDAGLETQIRQIGSKVHVFGHSHINLDLVLDGVRYVQNAVRYPRERARSGAVPMLKVVWP